MLTICITPTALNFENLDDDTFLQIQEKHGVQFVLNPVAECWSVIDEPAYLYKLLHKLSYDYDIEIV